MKLANLLQRDSTNGLNYTVSEKRKRMPPTGDIISCCFSFCSLDTKTA